EELQKAGETKEGTLQFEGSKAYPGPPFVPLVAVGQTQENLGKAKGKGVLSHPRRFPSGSSGKIDADGCSQGIGEHAIIGCRIELCFPDYSSCRPSQRDDNNGTRAYQSSGKGHSGVF